jgi:hypothetical protein
MFCGRSGKGSVRYEGMSRGCVCETFSSGRRSVGSAVSMEGRMHGGWQPMQLETV